MVFSWLLLNVLSTLPFSSPIKKKMSHIPPSLSNIIFWLPYRYEMILFDQDLLEGVVKGKKFYAKYGCLFSFKGVGFNVLWFEVLDNTWLTVQSKYILVCLINTHNTFGCENVSKGVPKIFALRYYTVN